MSCHTEMINISCQQPIYNQSLSSATKQAVHTDPVIILIVKLHNLPWFIQKVKSNAN